MNIFILDKDPILAASYHCDKLCNKMTTETAQMLNTNSIILGGGSYKRDYAPYTNYKLSYPNHPCTKWARESFDNTMWLINHGLALAEQFEIRYGHKHKAKKAIQWVKDFGKLPDKKGLTPFVICVKDDFKKKDPVYSYRLYYCMNKASYAKWEKGISPPLWFRKFKEPNKF